MDNFKWFSFLLFPWIIVFVLNSIFFQTVGLQGEPLYFPSLSIRWVKFALAERNEDENHNGVVEVLGQEVSVHNKGVIGDGNNAQNHKGIQLNRDSSLQRNRKPFYMQVQNKKCNSSFHHSFLQLLMLICVPRPGSKLNNMSAKQRYRVLSEEVDLVYSNRPVDPNDSMDTKFPENKSDSGPVYNDVSIQTTPPESETIHDVISLASPFSPSIHHDEIENGIHDETGEVVDVSNTASASRPTIPEDELGAKTPQTERKINKTHISTLNLTNIQVRREPGDGLYNYASDSKGAKVLATNKEAKGAASILNRDKDKYLRTPCSAESKFFDLELSEETLIISIAIANHEFYSSTVRQFELWGSLVYPTEDWVFLGMFEAENIRTMQMFEVTEPKWVRYLRTRMLNHYGSDFYCTLSVLEVYGVDAIEWLLEDWIAEEASSGSMVLGPQGKSTLKPAQPSGKALSGEKLVEPESYTDAHKLHSSIVENDDDELLGVIGPGETYNFKDINTGDRSKPVYQQTIRPALDSVMKLLMQKVRSLEHNQPLVLHYIQEVSNRYKEAFKGFNHDLTLMNNKLDAAVREVENLRSLIDDVESRWMHEKHLMQENLVDQLTSWKNDMELLRNHLKSTESKGMVALTIALLSTVCVIAMQIISFCLHLVRLAYQNKKTVNNHPPSTTLWMVPFLSCIIVVFVLSL